MSALRPLPEKPAVLIAAPPPQKKTSQAPAPASPSTHPALRTVAGASTFEPASASRPSWAAAPTAPAETIEQKRARLAPEIGAIKSTLFPIFQMGLPLAKDQASGPANDLQRINATLASVGNARDRSFVISELSDSELGVLGSYGGNAFKVAMAKPEEKARVGVEYQKLLSTIGSCADGYQATRVLKHLPERQQEGFIDMYARCASPQYRKDFASTVAGDPDLKTDTKRLALERTYLAATTPAERDSIAADSNVQSYAKQSGGSVDTLLRGPPLTNDASPPITWRHMGTPTGDVLIANNAAAQSFLERKRQGRVDALARAGEDHDTKVYGPSEAQAQVAEMRPKIEDASRRYGLDRALLSGVLASEIDFDTDSKDIAQNIASSVGIHGGQGPGAANVHLGDLKQAKDYLVQHNLPGAQDAAKFDPSFENVHKNPVEAAAIVVAWKADLKRQAGGTVTTPQDMATLFGAYRAGEKNFDLRNNRILTGADDLVRRTCDPNAAMGSNAYQAQPYFDYYIEYFKGVDAATTGRDTVAA